ncbi:19870_t:CDS:1, partial [Racocetra fulgida]
YYPNYTISPDVFALDVSSNDNYKWVTAYDPVNSITPIPTPTVSPTPSSKSTTSNTNFGVNIGAIIGGVIGGIAGLILLSCTAIIVILIVKKKYLDKDNIAISENGIANTQPIT